MELFRCLVVIATLSLPGCQEDPEYAANRVFVESSTLLEQYQALPHDALQERLILLQQVRENLDRIVSEYPESSLAVEIVSSGAARHIALDSIAEDSAFLISEIEEQERLTQAAALCAQDYFSCIVQEILRTVDGQDDSYALSGVAREVAYAFASAGLIDEASDYFAQAVLATSRIEDEMIQDIQLRFIARRMVEADFIELAVDTSTLIHDSYARAMVQALTIAQAQINIQNSEAAHTTLVSALSSARSIEDTFDRRRAIGAIARLLVVAGNIDDAEAVAEEESNAFSRRLVLSYIAEGLAMLGNIPEALEIMGSIGGGAERAQVGVVQAYLDREDFASAQAYVQAIDDSQTQVRAIAAIVEAYAATGDLASARTTLQQIAGDSIYDATAASFAYYLVRDGSRSEAFSLAEGLMDVDSRNLAYTLIATAEAESGDVDSALNTLRLISPIGLRRIAMIEIVEAQASLGNVPDALQQVSYMEDDTDRVEALGRILSHLD